MSTTITGDLNQDMEWEIRWAISNIDTLMEDLKNLKEDFEKNGVDPHRSEFHKIWENSPYGGGVTIPELVQKIWAHREVAFKLYLMSIRAKKLGKQEKEKLVAVNN